MADVEVLFEGNEWWPVYELEADAQKIKRHREYWTERNPNELRWIIKVPEDLLQRYNNVMEEFREMQHELEQLDPVTP